MSFVIQTIVLLYVLYIVISAIRTIFFHPLGRLPGPKLWIAFPFFQHIAAVRGQLDHELRRFHQQYGEVVRYGEDEVSFTPASAWQAIYGPGIELPKPIYAVYSKSGILNANLEDHARIRKAMALAFSVGLQREIPLLRARDLYPWLVRGIMAILSSSLTEAQKRQDAHTRAMVQQRMPRETHRNDFMEFMLRPRGEKGELSVTELEANANIIIAGGSEPTATLLTGLTYWLLRTPTALVRATEEVRSQLLTEEEISFVNLTTRLPYLQACITETFRMYPPVPTGRQRVTLATTKIAGHQIPPRTKVAVYQLAAYQSEQNFHDAGEFHPERWLPEAKDPSSSFYHDQREVLRLFSVGTRDCIGRQLAYREIWGIMARVLWHFDLELVPGQIEWNMQRSFTIWEKGALEVFLRERHPASVDVPDSTRVS
ncbi:benzoate 4-monooxygenase cytochrome P450 [Aspergillus neoniger CBS 115656]|uniref:Benzoate 4-monooxygenase cytochrome P450 n=1 Tax=Aspergillus neoniger (strain CBS 115656) TaxID=1448310 RepID=A0A318YI28_ASPNB|nr:benzoate 4-monooxygenase cytochrome P450 [Aspergillus neoniger CBS 115656]PYH33919.1 benzoate 4-monooxygenase cytochrome P450 [Aspergillus neoniger CBS 115656]